MMISFLGNGFGYFEDFFYNKNNCNNVFTKKIRKETDLPYFLKIEMT